MTSVVLAHEVTEITVLVPIKLSAQLVATIKQTANQSGRVHAVRVLRLVYDFLSIKDAVNIVDGIMKL